jgi:hypothetical protein
VQPSASAEEIAARYQAAVQRLTAEAPNDPSAPARLHALYQAYATVGDPAARAQYDRGLRGGSPIVVAPSLGTVGPPPPRAVTVGPRPWTLKRILVIAAACAFLAWRFEYFYRLVHPSSPKGPGDVALAYAGAVVAFQHAHGRPPLLGPPDWPSKLGGPVDDAFRPYLASTPGYVLKHPFDVIQTRSRSGAFPSPASEAIQVTSTSHDWVIQYVPFGRTFSFKLEDYAYNGYLVLVTTPYTLRDGTDGHHCEAWSDPPKVLCDDALTNRPDPP